MKYGLLFIFLSLTACTKSYETLQPKVTVAVDNWACSDLQSSLFDVAYAALIDLKTIPSKSEFVELFETNLSKKKTAFNHDEFLKNVGEFYEVILSQSHEDVPSMLQKVAAAELGSQADPEAEKVHKNLLKLKQKWSEVVVKSNGECGKAPLKINAIETSLKNTVFYGAQKTLAVAYQSCESIRKLPMVSETQDTEGIAIEYRNFKAHFNRIYEV